jgi:uncharacterized membrane protein
MFLKLYFITLPVFFAIDMVWLGLVAKNFYSQHIGYLMAKNPNWIAAIIFYFLFIAGLVYFVISPALLQKSWTLAILSGAFFGLITYATYDLTNLATLEKWPLIVTVVDLLWGMTLSALVSYISVIIARTVGL